MGLGAVWPCISTSLLTQQSVELDSNSVGIIYYNWNKVKLIKFQTESQKPGKERTVAVKIVAVAGAMAKVCPVV